MSTFSNIPLNAAVLLYNEINKLFDNLLGLNKDQTLFDFSPHIDIISSKKFLIIKCDLPGIDEKDIEITFKKNFFIIKGVRKRDKLSEGSTYFMVERPFGQFIRTIEISKKIDESNIKAIYKNGVLEITIPINDEPIEKQITIEKT